MAKDISTTPGMGTDPNYLNGNIVDNQTKVAAQIHQDIIQFFQKLMQQAGITINDLNDNEANGYQFIQALQFNAKKYLLDFTYIEPSSNTLTISGEYDLSKILWIKATGDSVINTLDFDTLLLNDYAKIIMGSEGTKTFQSTGNLILPGGAAEITIEPDDFVSFVKAPQYHKFLVSVINKSVPINEKIIEIGDWNMYVTGGGVPWVHIPHGLPDIKNIRLMGAIIRDDAENYRTQLSTGGHLQLNLVSTPDKISLGVDSGGFFDTVDYQATSYNRGWIYIKYV